MLHDRLKNDMRDAMKTKDSVRLGTLRLVLSACTNRLVEMKKKPTEPLEDGETVRVLRRLVKQRQEAAAQFRSAGQGDRADSEDSERAVLESYLPAMLSDDEIHAIIARLREKDSFEHAGKLIQAVIRESGGRADGSVVSRIVSELFSG